MASFCLMLLFQNFDVLNTHLVSRIDPSDIRVGAPQKPMDQASIAQPNGGSDLGSIGANWAGRQAHLLANGADDRLLKEANAALDRIFGSSKSYLDEQSSETGESGSKIAANAGTSRMPASVHMARLGQIELGFHDQTKFSCEVEGGHTAWSLSRPINSDIDLRLQHDTKDAASTLQLHVSW